MTAGHALGLLMVFALTMIPSAIFVGVVLGKLLDAPLWLRCTASIICAAAMSYAIVFDQSGGSADTDDCSPAGAGIYNTC